MTNPSAACFGLLGSLSPQARTRRRRHPSLRRRQPPSRPPPARPTGAASTSRRRPGRAISTACWNAGRQVLRALQPLAVLHRQGPRARHLRRPDPRIRALVNKKYAAQLGKRPLTAVVIVATATRCWQISRRARRCRGRQHQGPARTAERRRLRGPRRERRRRRDPGDRPGDAGHRVDRRPFGQDRAPARGLEPDAEHEGLERALQAGRQARGKLVYVPNALEDEDLLEMLNAGLLQAVVVDDWKARMWAQVLPR
jgi:hypothetical protein